LAVRREVPSGGLMPNKFRMSSATFPWSQLLGLPKRGLSCQNWNSRPSEPLCSWNPFAKFAS
jgi:hypothetical protein